MSTTPRIRAPVLLAYGGLSAPLQILYQSAIVYIPTFYAVEVGVSLSAVGVVFLVARVFDGITDPLIGGWSDRTRVRLGPRKTWATAGAPILMVTTYFLFMPTTGVGMGYLLGWVSGFFLAWTMMYIPYLSWGVELSVDYRDRNRVTGYREAATMLGILMAVSLPLVLLPGQEPPMRDVLGLLGQVSLVLLPVMLLVAVWVVPDVPRAESDSLDWRTTVRALIANRPFLRFLAALVFVRTGIGIFDAVVLLLIMQVLRLGGASGYLPLIFLMYIVAVSASPGVVALASRIGKHRAMCLALALLSAAMLSLGLIPRGSMVAAALAFAVYGLALAGTYILPTSIIADAVDYGMLKGGGQESGAYMAVFNLVVKVCGALGIGIALPLLDAAGFDATVQNEGGALLALALVGSVLAWLPMVPATLLLWNYPISARKHAIIRRALARRLGRRNASPVR